MISLVLEGLRGNGRKSLAGYSSQHANREKRRLERLSITPNHDGDSRDDVLAEVAFEPIDGRVRRRSGVTKRAKTQRPRNYA